MPKATATGGKARKLKRVGTVKAEAEKGGKGKNWWALGALAAVILGIVFFKKGLM